MAKKKSNNNTFTTVELYKGIRKTWGSLNPVTRHKGDDKKAASKKACRSKAVYV